MRGDKRVVVTGLGAITGLGSNLETYWESLRAGRSSIKKWLAKDGRIASKIGGDLSDFSVDAYVERAPERERPWLAKLPRLLRGTPQGVHLTSCAAAQAYADAGIEGAVAPARIAHVCAGQNLSLGYYAENLAAFQEHPDDIEPLLGMIAL